MVLKAMTKIVYTLDATGLNTPVIGTCHIGPPISPITKFTARVEAQAIAQGCSVGLFERGGLEARFEETPLKGEVLSQSGMLRRDFLRVPVMGR